MDALKGTLYESPPMLMKALDEIYRFPLTNFATDSLNRLLRSGASDEKLAEAVLLLREESRLCQITEDGEAPDSQPRIICSMGLVEEERR